MESKRAYRYKGKLYGSDWWKDGESEKYAGSLEDLVSLLADDPNTDVEERSQTYYTVGGEFYATEDDLDPAELIDYVIDNEYPVDLTSEDI